MTIEELQKQVSDLQGKIVEKNNEIFTISNELGKLKVDYSDLRNQSAIDKQSIELLTKEKTNLENKIVDKTTKVVKDERNENGDDDEEDDFEKLDEPIFDSTFIGEF